MKRNLFPILAVLAGLVGVTLYNAVYTVHETRQAIVLQFGEPVRAVQEPGLRFKIPFIQNVLFFSDQILNLDGPPEEVIAQDRRRLVVDSFARYRITDPLRFYQTFGSEATGRSRLANILNSSVRQVLGNFDSNNIISGERAQSMQLIRDRMNSEVRNYGIELVDVRIRRADYPQEVSQAIFRRMQTEREQEAREIRAQGFELAERIRADADRQRTVILAEARKQAETLRGEGDGQRARLFAQATRQDPEFFAFYRSLQAYSNALRDENTQLILSPDSEFFRYFERGGATVR